MFANTQEAQFLQSFITGRFNRRHHNFSKWHYSTNSIAQERKFNFEMFRNLILQAMKRHDSLNKTWKSSPKMAGKSLPKSGRDCPCKKWGKIWSARWPWKGSGKISVQEWEYTRISTRTCVCGDQQDWPPKRRLILVIVINSLCLFAHTFQTDTI